jgi:putative transcriptional regulator
MDAVGTPEASTSRSSAMAGHRLDRSRTVGTTANETARYTLAGSSGEGYCLGRVTVNSHFVSLSCRVRFERVGITLANLSILKTGKARAIRFSTLDAICRALECQPCDLLACDPATESLEEE